MSQSIWSIWRLRLLPRFVTSLCLPGRHRAGLLPVEAFPMARMASPARARITPGHTTPGSRVVAPWRAAAGPGVAGVAVGVALAGAVACSSPDLSGPPQGATVWALTLNAHAVTLDTMAPYDTLTLLATVRDAQGQPITRVQPTFTSSDSSVRVSAAGVLQARRAVGRVRVIATVVDQGVRVADTAYVAVTARTTATPPLVFDTLRLAVQSGDTAIPAPSGGLLDNFEIYAPVHEILDAVAQDGSGTRIPGALVALRASRSHAEVIVDGEVIRHASLFTQADRLLKLSDG